MNRINLLNKKFKRLTVVSLSNKIDAENRKLWKCKCKCGRITYASTYSLRKGIRVSCGCLRSEYVRSYKKDTRHVNLVQIFNAYRDSAKKRCKKFELTLQQFDDIVSQKCFYCAAAPRTREVTRFRKGSKYSRSFNGIDRVDNNIGYTIKNCVPCCATCNTAKSALNVKEFINHVRKIYETSIRGQSC